MSKRIPLTRGAFAIVDDEDFEWLTYLSWFCTSNGYAKTSIGKIQFYMHQLIMNPPYDMTVDHINCKKLDNRKENLRVCTMKQNNQNIFKRRTSNPYKGVFWCRYTSRWFAQISIDHKSKFLGRHKDAKTAARAYDTAARVSSR